MSLPTITNKIVIALTKDNTDNQNNQSIQILLSIIPQ